MTVADIKMYLRHLLMASVERGQGRGWRQPELQYFVTVNEYIYKFTNKIQIKDQLISKRQKDKNATFCSTFQAILVCYFSFVQLQSGKNEGSTMQKCKL